MGFLIYSPLALFLFLLLILILISSPFFYELQYVPNTYVDLTEEQAKEVLDLVDRLEGDDDVQNVYHNLR